jgi:ribonuclease HI
LPEGSQAGVVLQASEGIGKRLRSALGYSGESERTVLVEIPVPLDVRVVIEEQAEAKAEAERSRPGLTIFTDGSGTVSGAAGYAVAWQNRQRWVGIRAHIAYSQEAFDVECAALARALEVAARRQTPPARVTIFTDSQAAIRRMVSEEPGPGQKYVIQARKWIWALQEARPDVVVEIRWCPAHEGVIAMPPPGLTPLATKRKEKGKRG